METLPTAVICAWCQAIVSGTLPARQLSHGICVPCANDFVQRLPADYLRSIASADGSVTLFSGEPLAVQGNSAPAA